MNLAGIGDAVPTSRSPMDEEEDERPEELVEQSEKLDSLLHLLLGGLMLASSSMLEKSVRTGRFLSGSDMTKDMLTCDCMRARVTCRR